VVVVVRVSVVKSVVASSNDVYAGVRTFGISAVGAKVRDDGARNDLWAKETKRDGQMRRRAGEESERESVGMRKRGLARGE